MNVPVQRPVVALPDPELLVVVILASIGEFLGLDEDVVEKVGSDVDTLDRTPANPPHNDLAFEGTENNETELGCVSCVRCLSITQGCCYCGGRGLRRTVHVGSSSAMSNETFGSPQQIIETNAKANFLDDLIGIFGVDVVFNGMHALFVEILWNDLDQVRNFGLFGLLEKADLAGSVDDSTNQDEHFERRSSMSAGKGVEMGLVVIPSKEVPSSMVLVIRWMHFLGGFIRPCMCLYPSTLLSSVRYFVHGPFGGHTIARP